MKILKRLQELSPGKKKALIFLIVAIVGFFLFRNYIIFLQKKFKTIQEETQTKTDKIKEQLNEISEKTERDFQAVEKAIEEFLEKVKEQAKQKNETENQSK